MRISARQIAVRYVLFAMVATAVNLLTQRVCLNWWSANAWGYAAAVGAGTLAGLVVKYVLDKRWIFMDRDSGLGAHSRKFTIYALAGIVTTVIFWTSETVFWLIFKTDLMREIGAILGLGVGYVIKYRLDRRFVFRPSPQ